MADYAMGSLADESSYDPFGAEQFANPAVKALISGAAASAKVPGQMMAPNPYPPGSEEAAFYDASKIHGATQWAPSQALNRMGTGAIVGVPVKGGEFVAGSGAVRPKKVLPTMPEVAERYPSTVPPVWKEDPNIPGKMFESKATSPEAAQVAKLRSAAQKEIDAGNYEPFFDPSKRFDVDPANYPQVQSTLGVLAQRPGPKNAAAYAAAQSPEAAARLDAAFQRGMQQQGGAENWYMMGQLEKEFHKEYGPELGSKMFKEKFADAMAATTGGASPKDNLVMAMYGNYLKNKGLSVPDKPYEYPFPVGGRYAEGNMAQYRKMLMEGSGLTPANPKRYNFSGNYLGNKAGSTIDEQMMGLIEPGGALSPPKGAYGNYEGPVAARAAAAGVDPRYFQEVAWAGAKDAKDAAKGGFKAQPMISIVNEAIERTHRITGMPKDEIVRRGLVRSEIPIYGAAGALGMGALADQSRYGDQP